MKKKQRSASIHVLAKRTSRGRAEQFYRAVANILRTARSSTYRAINFVMVEAYWNVGRRIVEEEQEGAKRAQYGSALLRNLSKRLEKEFGPGFSEQSLRNMRQFFACFSIRSALRSELAWTHYKALIRVENEAARIWYAAEAATQNWSVRTLERQITSFHYERMLTSRNKKPIKQKIHAKTIPLASIPTDLIKDPYVLDFLGLKDNPDHRESDLEQAIIGKLQAFMLELGKGFAFIGRQQRISTETKDFYIDLVFYNYLLKCFVLIDLKTTELTHQDIGQMDMYVRLFEDTIKRDDDSPTVGVILCAEKDHTVVKYSVLNESKQLFASRYMLYLPTEKELRKELKLGRDTAVRETRAAYEIAARHHRQDDSQLDAVK